MISGYTKEIEEFMRIVYSVWPKNRNICKIIAIEAHSGAKFEEKMRYKIV